MTTLESYAAARSQSHANLIKFTSLLISAEPVWIATSVTFVYISVISGWTSYVTWLCLAFAYTPFLISWIRYGRPSRRTPFDIPIAILLGSVIVGMVVSEQFSISLGAFQTLLAAMALYYAIVNYSKPSRLITIGLPLAVTGAVVTAVVAIKWYCSGIHVPHGLGMALVIIAIVALGITVFNGKIIYRALIGLLGSMLLAAVILFFWESIHRLLTLGSIESRMWLWLGVLSPIEGSSLWTGLGLGCWPLANEYYRWGHVHNIYLELYINMGVIGLIAFICFLAIGAKLAVDIIYSPRNKSLYYGFGIGVLCAILFTLLLGFLESAPLGFGLLYGEEESYHYILSPVPWILAGFLIIARRLLREGSTTESTELR